MGYRTIRRSNTEIMLEILKNARKPLPPTRLMQDCNLAWGSARKMTEFLVVKGFLKQLPPPESTKRKGPTGRRAKCLYVTTEKGVQLLEQVEGTPLAELFEYGKEAEG